MGLKGIGVYGTAAITGGTIAGVSGVPVSVASWGVPVIGVSSGTMGNNGAVSALTALSRTYSNGAWLYLPAGAIAAGVPAAAGYYWFVGSSATAGTVYNSTYSGTGVPVVGATTAFSTTGPGAFTGDTSETGILITVPASAMGTNGNISIAARYAYNNSAGTKTFRTRFSGASGTVFSGPAGTTTTSASTFTKIWNTGSASMQLGDGMHQFSTGNWSITAAQVSAVNTAVATSVFVSGQRNTATDNIEIIGGEIITSAA